MPGIINEEYSDANQFRIGSPRRKWINDANELRHKRYD